MLLLHKLCRYDPSSGAACSPDTADQAMYMPSHRLSWPWEVSVPPPCLDMSYLVSDTRCGCNIWTCLKYPLFLLARPSSITHIRGCWCIIKTITCDVHFCKNAHAASSPRDASYGPAVYPVVKLKRLSGTQLNIDILHASPTIPTERNAMWHPHVLMSCGILVY